MELFDHQAEESLIGACLLSDIAVEDSSHLISADDFNSFDHQAIYHAILETRQTAKVDPVTVADTLRRNGHVGDKFTVGALHGYLVSTPSVSNAVKYALVIAEWKLRWRLLYASTEIKRLAESGGRDAGDAADQARELLAGLDLPEQQGPPDKDIDTFLRSVDTTHDWLVDDFLERKDRLLITAGEGHGKSVLLAQIAVCVAAGLHPWTFTMQPPRNVLVIDCENSERLLTRRFSGLRAKVANELDPQRLRIHCRPQGLDLTTRADRRWLLERVRANSAELLIIGPAYRLSAGVAERGDIGGEDQARKVTKALDDIRNRCNVALIMETHAPHGNLGGRDLRPFGSSVWLRWPEFGLGLRKEQENDQRFTLEHWRGPRDKRTWPLSLDRGGPWMWNPIMPGLKYL